MSIGIGIFLVVVGAVLAFAVKADATGIDLHLIGWILMGAGLVVVVISAVLLMPRTRRSRSTAVTTDAVGRQYVTERDDRIDGV